MWSTRVDEHGSEGIETSFLMAIHSLQAKEKNGNMRKSHYGSCLGMVVQRVNESKKQRKRVAFWFTRITGRKRMNKSKRWSVGDALNGREKTIEKWLCICVLMVVFEGHEGKNEKKTW